ncbi:tripartite tricarboxylate transporter substrate binding protein [Ramlibacter monticola]|uniref:Tripartite tricarboxylate transporter substrate binding protein n=1 Tax=Ramlibacter monticola TaxID=1926872 RepID=A0A936YXJ8_9BURK|nr:tripartite tricarboxylate transporter substrate binding protein [Ramlibacter monticola]MBL0390426.1 tripartite tricarboxylate transporter substrate binding protein [Ramlibacter monticola]
MIRIIRMIRMIRIALLAVLAVSVVPLAALAADWPRGPLTIVVPLAAGDGGDTTARAMADLLAKELDTAVVVSNKPGAGGAVGVQQVIAARKDGYTLLFTQNSPLTIRRVLEPAAASYDPLRELAPLAITTRTPSVLVVRKEAPFDTFQELVAYARKNPGKLRIGNAGPGSAGDLSVQVINAVAETDLLSVPYKGAAPAVTDVLGGQVEGVILALGAVASHMKSGALKAVAISSPFPDLPHVPTLSKLGYRQDILGVWFAWMLPAGTPAEVAQVLLPALQRAARNPAVAARLLPLGIVQDWEPATRVVSEIRREYETVADVTSRLPPKR